MCKNGHRYRRLNDHQLFCQRCGTTMNIGSHWIRPYWPMWPNTAPYWTYTSTSTTPTAIFTSWNDVAQAALEDPNAEEREESNDRKD